MADPAGDVKIAQAILDEKVVIGTMIMCPETIPIVAARLDVGDLYLPFHRQLFRACIELHGFIEIGILQICDYLEIEKYSLVVEIADHASQDGGLFDHALPRIKDFARRREAQKFLLDAVGAAANPKIDLAAQSADIFERFGALLHEERTMVTAPEQVTITLKRLDAHEATDFLKLGYRAIDEEIGGMNRGELWIIAGRPGMGKSAFAANCAMNMARAGETVAFISVEGTNHSLMCRLLSMYSGVSLKAIRTGTMKDFEVAKVSHAGNVIGGLDLFRIADRESRWEKIKANIQQLKLRQPKLGVMFVDYIGLISVDGRRRERDRRGELEYMSADAKRLAASLNIAVVLLCQLNREVEKRKPRTPILSDLRESGSLEQDADVVLMLYRPAYYGESKDMTKAEVVIAKNREGNCGTVELKFEGYCVRFTEREA